MVVKLNKKMIWMKRIGLALLVVCALSGVFVTFHFYAPVRGVWSNGHWVSRAQLVDMVLHDYVEQHKAQ